MAGAAQFYPGHGISRPSTYQNPLKIQRFSLFFSRHRFSHTVTVWLPFRHRLLLLRHQFTSYSLCMTKTEKNQEVNSMESSNRNKDQSETGATSVNPQEGRQRMGKSNFRSIVAGLLTIFAASAVHAEPDYYDNKQFKDAQNIELDTSVFEQNIHDYFTNTNEVKGYSVVLVHKGQKAAAASGGWAQDDVDNGLESLPMDMTVHSNIGSVAKFLTGIALLKAFETPDPVANPDQLSVEELLDRKIHHYFPQAWKDISHDTISWLTFRDLLQHKSGFVTDGMALDVEERLAKGLDAYACSKKAKAVQDQVLAPDGYCHGKRKYHNMNFRLLAYLIAAYKYPAWLAELDALYEDGTYSADEVRDVLGMLFEQYMYTGLFSATNPPILGSCDPAVELPQMNAQMALHYTDAQDIEPGAVYSTKADQEDEGYIWTHCRGEGGWHLSAYDVANLMAHLQMGQVISKATYDSLYNPFGSEVERDDRLIWEAEVPFGSTSQEDDPDENKGFTNNGGELYTPGRVDIADVFGWKGAPTHGGDHTFGFKAEHGQRRTVGAHASIIRFPGGYHAVGLVNSANSHHSKVEKALVEAFEAAIIVE